MRSVGGLVLVVLLSVSFGGCPREDAAGSAIVQDGLTSGPLSTLVETAGDAAAPSGPATASGEPSPFSSGDPLDLPNGAPTEFEPIETEVPTPPAPAADQLGTADEPNVARLLEGSWQTELVDCEAVERVFAGGPDAHIDPVTQIVLQAWVPLPTPATRPCPQSVFDVVAEGAVTQFWFTGYRQVPARRVDLPALDVSVSWNEVLEDGSAQVTLTPYRSDPRGTQVAVHLAVEVRDGTGAIVDRAAGYQEQWLRGSRDGAWARTTSDLWRQFNELPPLGDLLRVQYSRRVRMQYLGE